MPPRSYFIEPRPSDYLAFARAYFPESFLEAQAFTKETGLPFIRSTQHLAAYLTISPSLIRQIIHRKNYHYREFPLVKSDGSARTISTPRTYLKVIQWWICDNILNCSKQLDVIHGFTRGRSFLTNAHSHLGCHHILNMDIEKFFPSITMEMISEQFRRMGYSADGADVLAELCSLRGSAPTGAPTSPTLGNLVLFEFDNDIQRFSRERSLHYTRYADDLTFSSKTRIASDVANEVESLVSRYGFRVNPQKTKFMGRGDRMEVTGVVINATPALPRQWRNWARGFLHRAAKNPTDYKGQWRRISGIYGSLKAFDPEERKRLTQKARETLNLVRPG